MSKVTFNEIFLSYLSFVFFFDSTVVTFSFPFFIIINEYSLLLVCYLIESLLDTDVEYYIHTGYFYFSLLKRQVLEKKKVVVTT